MSTTPKRALVAVSAHGRRLAEHVEGELLHGSSQEALPQAWRTHRQIVFFGAAGIAVRLIAPLLGSKTSDPAVVVVDDAGRYVISLASGHEGGANELAQCVARELGAETVISTASERLADRDIVLGIGCSKGASAEEIEALAREALASMGASFESAVQVASIDLKRTERGLTEFAGRWHLPIQYFGATELSRMDVPNPSAAVAAAAGTPSVAEAAALLAAGVGELLAPKQSSGNVTVALARKPRRGRLDIVGLGPGGKDQVTFEALDALRMADLVLGYRLYTDIVREWLPLAKVESSELGEEIGRARRAIGLAREGQRVALVSSGDAGIYALAGLVYEVLREDSGLDVRLIPGITAAGSAAALLGAPLMADFAAISLSDLHTPAETIRARLQAAAEADLVTVLYNPASGRRRELLAEAQRIFLASRGAGTPVGLVRNAYRAGQLVRISNLGELPLAEVDMLTTVVIGNSETVIAAGRMVTRRGGS